MSAYDTIRQAIQHKQQIVATYKGHLRVLCPYALGRGEDQRERALFYQVGGSSSKGLPPGGEWRCLILDELTNVSAQSGPWTYVANWNDLKQSCLEVITVEVSG
jgi:hypothetical protein